MSIKYIVLIISGIVALLSIFVFIKTTIKAMNSIDSSNGKRKFTNDLFNFGMKCITLGGSMLFIGWLTKSLLG